MLQDQNKLNDYRDKNLGEIDVEQLARAQFKESSSDNNHVSITPPPQLRDNLFDIFYCAISKLLLIIQRIMFNTISDITNSHV